MSEQPILHIYAQRFEHDGAKIVGNREALLDLKVAIDNALWTSEQRGKSIGFANDGEAFEIEVRLADDFDLGDMRLPYTETE